jgi:hypothetical protein
VAPEAVSTAAPPTEEEELEVVLGRRLLPSPAEIPLPRLIAKCQQVLQELEAGMRQEWEKLEAEDLRLSDWEHRLGDRIKSTTARHANERAKLLLERELLQEQLQEARDREAAACQREVEALKRHIAAEERMRAAADRERTARELADQARKVSAAVEAQEASVAALAAAAAKKEKWLDAREAKEMAQLQELQTREEAVEAELAAGTRKLQEREAAVEEELATETRKLQEREAALREREAKVEELLAGRNASIDQIARWVGAVNPLLEALGANPIWVSEAPSPLGTALQVLDSTAARLRDVEAGIQDLLETEGREVARGTAEYILTSFRSHNPAIQLTPVLVRPLRSTAATAREGVLEVVDMVTARLRRRPEPAESGSASGPPEQ